MYIKNRGAGCLLNLLTGKARQAVQVDGKVEIDRTLNRSEGKAPRFIP